MKLARCRSLLKFRFRINSGRNRMPFRPERLTLSRFLAPVLTALVVSLTLSGACANRAPVAPTPSPAVADPIAAPPPPAGLTPLTQIGIGRDGQCGLRESGRVVCQGNDYHLRPTMPLAAARFQQVTVGQEYACGLGLDKTITCWGSSEYGKNAPPPGQFTQVDAGKQHACALDTAGYAHCWGWDWDGRTTPPTDVVFTAIAAGGVHGCGLTANGTLQCWGKNDLGQANSHSGPFQSLALGIRNTCALRPDGAAWCQGDDAAGQSSPPPGAFTQIAAGELHTCGLRPEGRLECWGGGFGAELGEPAGKFTALSGGWDTFCALQPGGYPTCWRYQSGSAVPQLLPELTFRVSPVAEIRQPVELLSWPGGGLAVVQREGTLAKCIADNQSPCAAGAKPPLLDLTDRTDSSTTENGMLSAALDPDFDRFPFLYVYYTVRADPRKARLSRFPADNGQVDKAGELVILEQPMPNYAHYGGAIRFGPDDLLYLGIGENIFFPEDAQDLASLRGKIIRIDVRGASPEQPYTIPADNPMLAMPAARPEIWAYGLRNPWRMSFDAAGRLWVGDVGDKGAEEVSIVTAGANLGWPIFEGNLCYGGQSRCAALTDATPPLVTYTQEEGCAIIWGGQYRGAALPQLAGAYIFGDFCSGRIWALTPDAAGGGTRQLLATADIEILSFGVDAAGEMYVLALNQPVLTLAAVLAAGPAAENPAADPG